MAEFTPKGSNDLDPNASGAPQPEQASGDIYSEAPHAQPPAQTSHREGYWTPPTDAQIARAQEFGFDLTQQQKYHSPDEWANRG